MSTPDRLNERPIWLRAELLVLALVQICMHLYHDYSGLRIPASPITMVAEKDQRTNKIRPIPVQIQDAIPSILQRTAIVSAVTSLLTVLPYTVLLRRPFWSVHLMWAKLFFKISRSDARPTGYPPSTPSLIFTSFLLGFLLVLTWELTSLLFTVFIIQPPIKAGVPLSANSKDPNATLLNGLQAKRDIVKCFAFWELAIIAQTLPDRRKLIFADITRAGGPCWSQMLETSLDVLRGINTRIADANNSTTRSATTQRSIANDSGRDVSVLPKIAQLPSTRPIVAGATPPRTSGEKMESILASSIKQFGQSPKPFMVRETSTAQKAQHYLDGYMAVVTNTHDQWWEKLGKSPAARLFMTSKAQTINSIILGTPYASTAVIVDAVDSMTRMLVASLSEDTYGKVVSGVPETVRTYAQTILAIEGFVQSQAGSLDGGLEDVENVVARLKIGLKELLSAFQLYLTDQGLSVMDYKEANKAAEDRSLLPREQSLKQVEDRRNAHVGRHGVSEPQARPPNPRQRSGQSQASVAQGQATPDNHHKNSGDEHNRTRRIEAPQKGQQGWTAPAGRNAAGPGARLERPREMEMVR